MSTLASGRPAQFDGLPEAELDVYAAALNRPARGLLARWDDGAEIELPLERWLGPATSTDERVLATAVGPVLDVGCGPGRHVVALRERGVEALGVDVSAGALRLARARGAAVLGRSVFERVPGRGTWQTALLLDGNIGIGADPVMLLRRLGALLAPCGRVIVELEPPGAATRTGIVRLAAAGRWSRPFPWARLGVDGVAAVTAAAGLAVHAVGPVEERWFAVLSAAPRAG